MRTDFWRPAAQPGVFDDEATRARRTDPLPALRPPQPAAFAAGFRRILRDGGYDALHDHQDYASGWHYLIGAGRAAGGAGHPRPQPGLPDPQQLWRHRGPPADGAGRQAAGGRATPPTSSAHRARRSRPTASTRRRSAARRRPRSIAASTRTGSSPARRRATSVREEFGWPADARRRAVRRPLRRLAGARAHPQPQELRLRGRRGDRLRAPRPDGVRFVFAGPFSEATPILRARIEAAGLGERIAFAGVRRDIGRLMAGADALFFPSRAEGLGMVAVEAQAAGLPVLASTGVPRECVVVPELVRFLAVTTARPPGRDALLAIGRRAAARSGRRQPAGGGLAVRDRALGPARSSGSTGPAALA